MKKVILSTWVAVVMLASVDCPGATMRYQVTGLGTLGGTESVAGATNNKGQVVGGAESTDGSEHAYMYNGKMHNLGMWPHGPPLWRSA